MSGERSEEARALLTLFSSKARLFGWHLRAAINRNITVASEDGDAEEHTGVDGLFTLDCPFTGRKRGIVVDGKRYKWNSMRKPLLAEFTDGVVEQCGKLRRSTTLLNDEHGIEEDVDFDTAILAWDCYEGWNPELYDRWMATLPLQRVRAKQPILGLVYSRPILDRLATIAELRQKVSALEFHYQLEKYVVGWSKVLAPEAVCSPLIAIRWKDFPRGEVESPHWKKGVLYFHQSPTRNARFIVPFLQHHGMQNTAVAVYAHAEESAIPLLQTQIDHELEGERPGRFSQQREVQILQLSAVEFRS